MNRQFSDAISPNFYCDTESSQKARLGCSISLFCRTIRYFDDAD